MQVVSSSRTMASAKPKFREPEEGVVVRNMVEIRQQKMREWAAAQRKADAARQEAIALAMEKARIEAEARLAEELADDEDYVPKRFRHTYRLIEERICRVFGVTRPQLMADRRDRTLVLARHAIMYWAARLTVRSLPEIGRLMNGRDHTTVLHGARIYPDKRKRMGRYLRPAYRSRNRVR